MKMLVKFYGNFLTKEKVEVFALNLFAISGFCAFGIANTVIAFLCIYALINYKDIRDHYKGSRIFYLFLFYAVYIAMSVVIFANVFPETWKIQIHSIYWWLAPWAFLIISWLIRGREQVAFQMLQFAFVGFLIRILIKSDWSLYRDWLSGGRYNFGYPWLLTSLFCAIFLAGVFIFRDEITKYKATIVLYYFFGVPFILFVMAVNQSRGMFIGLTLIIVFYFFMNIKNIILSYNNKRYFLVFSFVGFIFIFSQYGNIKNRFIDEKYLYEKILKFEIKEIPYSSIGARIHFADYSIKLIFERPLFGWGPGTSSTKYVTKTDNIILSGLDRENLSLFWHLHNIILEVSVRFGLIGLSIHLLIILFFTNLFIGSKRYRKNKFLNYFFIFAALNLYFNLYDFRYIQHDYRNYLILFMGIFFSQIVTDDMRKRINTI